MAKSSGLVKAGDRPAEIVAFEDALVTFFIDAADLLGVPKSVAAIYGICFASPEPLSFSDINERLDISSGSISQGLKVLREVGALKIAQHEKLQHGALPKSSSTNFEALNSRTIQAHEDVYDNDTDPVSNAQLVHARESGRRDATRYAPELELRSLLMHWIDARLTPQITMGVSRLQGIANSLPINLGEASSVQKRLGALCNWQSKAQSAIPLLKSIINLA